MTNQLSTFASSPTLSMSTREIAELTGKRHDNVVRDFKDVCEALEINPLKFEEVYVAGNGQKQVEYKLPKDLTTTLVSGYSIPMRHAIVKRRGADPRFINFQKQLTNLTMSYNMTTVLTTTTTPPSITMTSLELVQYLNHQREQGAAGYAKVDHGDFLKRVPKVLGEVAGNFSSYYVASNGKSNPSYNFPKREACLMAMSYSYDLQAKVFDKMTALEEEKAAAHVPQFKVPTNFREALLLAADQQRPIEYQALQEHPKFHLEMLQKGQSVALKTTSYQLPHPTSCHQQAVTAFAKG